MQHVEKHFTGGETVHDVVIGMADGLTVPFALAAGISGAIASIPGKSGSIQSKMSRSNASCRGL